MNIYDLSQILAQIYLPFNKPLSYTLGTEAAYLCFSEAF